MLVYDALAAALVISNHSSIRANSVCDREHMQIKMRLQCLDPMLAKVTLEWETVYEIGICAE